MQVELDRLARLRRDGAPRGVTSVCSAHPVVLRAALRFGRATGTTGLIEATCNQVNHRGGYTGMRPTNFAALVALIAKEDDCPSEQIILGRDQLGPNPWRDRPPEGAIAEAERTVEAYVAAAFRKTHPDASMGCAGEPPALDDEVTAGRAARLAVVPESVAVATGGEMPAYIIGTEVPPPGGADHALHKIEPTAPDSARHTMTVHREVFEKAGRSEAFARVIGPVVQPGVEFGNHNVIFYERDQARDLTRVLEDEPQFVFEAHSTDYQGVAPFRQLVEDGFPILKVGPELTFVLQEALYTLDLIASDLLPDSGDRLLAKAMETLMLQQPDDWNRHHDGDEAETRVMRQYSLSDRIRYYWAAPEAQAAVDRLMAAMKGQSVPLPLPWQHLPQETHIADTPLDPQDLLVWRVQQSPSTYHQACVP
jgi:D-tagatose 6-phosphate 4-epimerase